MTRHEELAFHARREAECRAMARVATEPGIAEIHANLARLHADARAHEDNEPAENYGAGGTWWWPQRRVPAFRHAHAVELVAG